MPDQEKCIEWASGPYCTKAVPWSPMEQFLDGLSLVAPYVIAIVVVILVIGGLVWLLDTLAARRDS